jgi:zinc protease
LLGDLPATGAALPARADMVIKGGVTVAPFPGPQSVVLFGHGGIRFDDPDFIAASVINDILGGGRFTARLMTEVREKRGLTYGIGTGLSTSDHSEALMGQFSASNENVAEAMDVIRAEWAKIATEGVTEAELSSAKTFMTGAYPLRFDGNGTIASILVGMQIMGLPTTYPATRNARVEAVTMQDIKRVAARLLKPDDLYFVVVGEPVGVTSTE